VRTAQSVWPRLPERRRATRPSGHSPPALPPARGISATATSAPNPPPTATRGAVPATRVLAAITAGDGAGNRHCLAGRPVEDRSTG
ncbi:MAG TPA: hypothetical protein VGY54_03930, partial [Polyangiaceae bacterium]|nr:hypothetical protein [Polyangiaceae bacterium]